MSKTRRTFGESLEKLHLEKDTFGPPAKKGAEKLAPAKDAPDLRNSEKIEIKTQQTKATSEACDDNKISKAKNVEPQKETVGKETDVSISLLNIQVGLIRKAWKHPSADSLLVEEIDVGDGNVRQVVSGLAKYCTPEELTNRLVVLVTNVKPGKLRDVMSAGLHLLTDSNGVATFKGIPFMTSAGLCTSSIPNAGIK